MDNLMTLFITKQNQIKKILFIIVLFFFGILLIAIPKSYADPGDNECPCPAPLTCSAQNTCECVAPDCTVICDGQTYEDFNDIQFNLQSTSGKVIRNCTFKNARLPAIRIENSSNILVENCNFENLRHHIIGKDLIALSIVGDSHNVTVRNSKFVDIGADGVQMWSLGEELKDIYIENNEFWVTGVNGENGIDIKSTTGPIYITGNNIHGFRPCDGDVQDCSGSSGDGMVVHGDPDGPATNIIIEKNTFWNNTYGLAVASGGSQNGGTPRDVIVRNNIFYDNLEIGLRVNPPSVFEMSHNTFYNNNDHHVVMYLSSPGSGCERANNLFIGPGGTEEDKCSPQNDLMLSAADVQVADLAGRDLHLRRTSPAVDAGATFLNATEDIDDQSRPNGSAYDVGADEYYNWIPDAVDDSFGTDVNNDVDINVLSNDTDYDGDILDVTNIGTPAHGTATLNADKTIHYSPNSNFTGTDTFTYTINDGYGGSDTATVTIVVARPGFGSCYAMGEGPLVRVEKDGTDATVTGNSGRDNIRAMAFHPDGIELYAIDGYTLGKLDAAAGIFTPIGSASQCAAQDSNNQPVNITVDDLRGMAFATDGTLWAVERDGNGGDGSHDFLLQLDPTTGKVVANTFGTGLSCIEISGASGVGNADIDDNIEDIAIDRNGIMYGIFSAAGQAQKLVTIDTNTGIATAVGNGLGIPYMKGLGLSPLGDLVGTTDNNSASAGRNTLYYIDADTGTASVTPGGYLNLEVAGEPAATNFRAVDCRPHFAPDTTPFITGANDNDFQLSWPQVTQNDANASINASQYLIYRDTTPYLERNATNVAAISGPFTANPLTWIDADHVGDTANNYFYYIRTVVLDEYHHKTFSDLSNHTGEFDFPLVPGSN